MTPNGCSKVPASSRTIRSSAATLSSATATRSKLRDQMMLPSSASISRNNRCAVPSSEYSTEPANR
jgi:hypothetical protein